MPYLEGKYGPKELHRIIGGLLTMDSDWKPPLGGPFEKALVDFGGDGSLDIGCALHDGAFEVTNEDGSLTRSEAESGPNLLRGSPVKAAAEDGEPSGD